MKDEHGGSGTNGSRVVERRAGLRIAEIPQREPDAETAFAPLMWSSFRAAVRLPFVTLVALESVMVQAPGAVRDLRAALRAATGLAASEQTTGREAPTGVLAQREVPRGG